MNGPRFIPTSELPCPEDDEIEPQEEYTDLQESMDDERRHDEKMS